MSSFSSQPIVIDGKGHLLGRLASIVSKQVSQIYRVVILSEFQGGLGGVLEKLLAKSGDMKRADRRASLLASFILVVDSQ